MSADEFDPRIERLFAQAPLMTDEAAFVVRVEQRLDSGNRLRVLALAAAALVGGAVALKETLSAPVGAFLPWQMGEQIQTTSLGVGSRLQSSLRLSELRLSELPFADLGFGAVNSPSLFWIAALAVVSLAAVALTRLYQEV